ncbi:MAG: hypothetical protein NUW37_02740 [Planctomycetes bacterium]|nr:hypothetical protein [Planctomycetota bacterium]
MRNFLIAAIFLSILASCGPEVTETVNAIDEGLELDPSSRADPEFDLEKSLDVSSQRDFVRSRLMLVYRGVENPLGETTRSWQYFQEGDDVVFIFHEWFENLEIVYYRAELPISLYRAVTKLVAEGTFALPETHGRDVRATSTDGFEEFDATDFEPSEARRGYTFAIEVQKEANESGVVRFEASGFRFAEGEQELAEKFHEFRSAFVSAASDYPPIFDAPLDLKIELKMKKHSDETTVPISNVLVTLRDQDGNFLHSYVDIGAIDEDADDPEIPENVHSKLSRRQVLAFTWEIGSQGLFRAERLTELTPENQSRAVDVSIIYTVIGKYELERYTRTIEVIGYELPEANADEARTIVNSESTPPWEKILLNLLYLKNTFKD